MNIKIKRHTPVRMKKSDWHIFLDPPAYGHYGLPVHPQDIPRVKDLHTDLDPLVDTTDWYEDTLEYKKFKGDWQKYHDYMNEQIYKPKWWKFW